MFQVRCGAVRRRGGVMEMDGRPKLWVMVGEDEEGCNQKAPALSFFELAVLFIHDV